MEEITREMISPPGRPQSFIFGTTLQKVFAGDMGNVVLTALAGPYMHESSFSDQCWRVVVYQLSQTAAQTTP